MEEYVDVKTAAKINGMSEAWWRKKIWKCEVPSYKLGRRRLIKRDDIEDMMNACRVEARIRVQ
jgi:excisionase family DNA binding protein